MPLNLQEKYDTIMAQEEQFAYRLAKDVVKKPEVSVWMILLPVLFVHHIMRISDYKEGVRSFAENILKARQKALDRAFNELQSGTASPDSIQDYFPEVSLNTTQEKTLAQRQVSVIQELQKHYQAMLKQEGSSFEDLIRNAYQTAGEYTRFLNRLTDLEKDVNRFLVENFEKDDEYKILLKRVEEQTDVLRQEELKFFFK